MKLLNTLFGFLKKPTKYPPQQLTDKQKELLDLIDNQLVELHKDAPAVGMLNIHAIQIHLLRQQLPAQTIVDHLDLPEGTFYIPRCLALTSDADGNWNIFIGLRDTTMSDPITVAMFLDILGRTCNARVG